MILSPFSPTLHPSQDLKPLKLCSIREEVAVHVSEPRYFKVLHHHHQLDDPELLQALEDETDPQAETISNRALMNLNLSIPLIQHEVILRLKIPPSFALSAILTRMVQRRNFQVVRVFMELF